MCRVRPPTDVVVLCGEPILSRLAALAQLVERLTRKEQPASWGCSSISAQNPDKYWEVEGHLQTSALIPGIPFRIYYAKVSK